MKEVWDLKDIRALVSASLVHTTEEFGSNVTSAVVTAQVMSALHQSCDGSVRRSKLFFARCVRVKIVGKPKLLVQFCFATSPMVDLCSFFACVHGSCSSRLMCSRCFGLLVGDATLEEICVSVEFSNLTDFNFRYLAVHTDHCVYVTVA